MFHFPLNKHTKRKKKKIQHRKQKFFVELKPQSFLLDMYQSNNSQNKRKEIYRYVAPWTVYAMNWSIRPDKRFRLALGSFVEEYNNKVN